MYLDYHRRITPLSSFGTISRGMPVAVDRRGRVVVALATDYLWWTKPLKEAGDHLIRFLKGKTCLIWYTGAISPRVRLVLGKAGLRFAQYPSLPGTSDGVTVGRSIRATGKTRRRQKSQQTGRQGITTPTTSAQSSR